MVDRLSQEDKMMLAMIINDLRDAGPRTMEAIQAHHGSAADEHVLETLWAAGGIKFPWLLNRILTHSILRQEKREKRRISQLVEIGLHARLLVARGDRFDSTPAAERWSEDIYGAAGSEQYGDEMSVNILAVDICEALRKKSSLRTEEIHRMCAPRTHRFLRKDPAQRKMQEGRLESYARALELALTKAQKEGWIKSIGEKWNLTERGRDTGLRYFDHMR